VLNLGLLGYFKYADFFLQSFQQLLDELGIVYSPKVIQVILPVGISFYTFEAINYIVDVYRGKLAPARSLPRFLLFILFFPHLIAGPIVKAREFLPQIERVKKWNDARFAFGLALFVLGMIKKLGIGDRLGVAVDPIFEHPELYSSSALWYAAISFAIQVFCDFSGYTDMALGTAHMLGYKLTPNFAMPFLASNISEFWRRWHMSLSSWLRDYLFIPLGGSRRGEFRTCMNLTITMTIGGLWHGANWNYVLWGFLMGLLLCGHRQLRNLHSRFPKYQRFLAGPGLPFCVLATLLTFILSLVVFRNLSLSGTQAMFHGMFVNSPGKECPLPLRTLGSAVVLLILGHAAGYWLQRNGLRWRRLFAAFSPLMLGILLSMAATLCLMIAPGASKAFIYFQF
jgi:alginate O-acetyltransferase complex protein AlgI